MADYRNDPADSHGGEVRRAVVTGGAGFVGSTVVDLLLDRGCEVVVIDDLSNGDKANLADACSRGAELHVIDIRDDCMVRAAVRACDPDTVFHLAAQIDVQRSMAEPAVDAAINIVGSVNVFGAALEAGVRRVVNTSAGGALYGDAEQIPTPETAPTLPSSPYGLSKLAVEQYTQWFRRAKGLDVRTLRYGNVYGPRQDPHGDAGVIARFCRRALDGERPTIYGDGRQTRDFVFVHDVALANLAAADGERLPRTEYNIGTGCEVDLLTLAEAVAAAADLTPPAFRPRFEAARAGEVRRSCLDVSAARRDLSLPGPTPPGRRPRPHFEMDGWLVTASPHGEPERGPRRSDPLTYHRGGARQPRGLLSACLIGGRSTHPAAWTPARGNAVSATVDYSQEDNPSPKVRDEA